VSNVRAHNLVKGYERDGTIAGGVQSLPFGAVASNTQREQNKNMCYLFMKSRAQRRIQVLHQEMGQPEPFRCFALG